MHCCREIAVGLAVDLRRLGEQVGELADVRADLGTTVVPARDEMVQRTRNHIGAERWPAILAKIGRALELVADPPNG